MRLFCCCLIFLSPTFLIADQIEVEPVKSDKIALDIGHAVLRLDELGAAGAPLMSKLQMAEFEKKVAFLAETRANRMTWAWLEFRIRNDRELRLENNPGADAIRQRLNFFNQMLRKYFVFE